MTIVEIIASKTLQIGDHVQLKLKDLLTDV